jgi:hypothetical protein
MSVALRKPGSSRCGAAKYILQAAWVIVALFLAGCAVAPRYPVPAAAIYEVHPPGFEKIRVVMDPSNTNVLRSFGGVLGGFDYSGAADQRIRILALSGGGENGAYGAGLLCGWTEAGTRPQFDVVTGISTGSLIAPLAFLGSEFDPQLRHGYTEVHPSQVFLMRGFFGILKHRDAVADSKPLQQLIREMLGEKELAAIAREHRKGRRLLVMTTNLDAQKPVIWDIGAIAASGSQGSLELVRKILLASSSIPVAFPPVMFQVEAKGARYDELHVDGGVLAQVFGGGLLLAGESGLSTHAPAEFYLIRNGRMGAEYQVTSRKLAAIAGRSISTMMRMQAESDVLRAWMFSQMAGASFHYISIPDNFKEELKEPFDPEYMKALFAVGRQQALNGIPWQDTPAGLRGVKWTGTAQGK